MGICNPLAIWKCLLLGVLLASVRGQKCNFASEYQPSDFINNPDAVHAFLLKASAWEGNFSTHGNGIHFPTGLTYDGRAIDYETGLPRDPLHDFSAASKEAIHLGMLALALDNNTYATVFMTSAAAGTGMSVRDYMLEVLRRKINSYISFNMRYPGFGGYIPWYHVNDTGMFPAWDWQDRVPALDNGELIWSMAAVAHVLQKIGYPDLANMYWIHAAMMRKNSLAIFYQGNGEIRCVAKIRDLQVLPTPANYYDGDPKCKLDDPYEGELFAFFLDLYAPWAEAGYSETERDKIWQYKRTKLQLTTLNTASGPIDVEKGWWYSAHEKWKYMELPFLDVPVNRRVFLNGEKARVYHSIEKGIPGLFASVANVSQAGDYNPNYVSNYGAQDLAFEPVQPKLDVVTPYAAFPLMLDPETRPYGVAWYAAMLKGSKMQGPLGATESVHVAGTHIAPLLTWDSKITSVMAYSGGIQHLTRQVLMEHETYGRFFDLVSKEWGRVFGGNGVALRGSHLPFRGPVKTVPKVLPDFTAC